MPAFAPPICRFAPSPNGRLHLGHAFSALRNIEVAERLGGRLLLRLEDIDGPRCTPAFAAAILDDLQWLGFCWERPVRRQSEQGARYAAALSVLAGRGLVYPCFCSRGAVRRATQDRSDWPHDPDGSPLYPGTCRLLSAQERARLIASGTPHGLRLDMDRALASAPPMLDWAEFGEAETERRVPARPACWGDAVLRRKDIAGSYHIAVVVDDADQAVTDVVRGTDLFAATGLHRLLQVLLGLPTPRYHHHRLILGADGGKLSKSRQAPALADLRAAGATPADIARLIALELGPSPLSEATRYGSSVVSQ